METIIEGSEGTTEDIVDVTLEDTPEGNLGVTQGDETQGDETQGEETPEVKKYVIDGDGDFTDIHVEGKLVRFPNRTELVLPQYVVALLKQCNKL